MVGTAQLTEIPGLSRGGTSRLQVEAVRVRADLRGRGIGAAVLGWAVDEARRRGCGLVQLTTDTRRPEAHRFYERLGFTASSGSSDSSERPHRGVLVDWRFRPLRNGDPATYRLPGPLPDQRPS